MFERKTVLELLGVELTRTIYAYRTRSCLLSVDLIVTVIVAVYNWIVNVVAFC